ncbi:hypothetical protein [Ruegeria arenilitoris]|uniref:hypothetical protein n=1 Tax=Ruegeria arenilitoris TaxID=1173585 RepID=UPI00147B9358|nr:hypothetical protein [Ruegeria arenilitoris]
MTTQPPTMFGTDLAQDGPSGEATGTKIRRGLLPRSKPVSPMDAGKPTFQNGLL